MIQLLHEETSVFSVVMKHRFSPKVSLSLGMIMNLLVTSFQGISMTDFRASLELVIAAKRFSPFTITRSAAKIIVIIEYLKYFDYRKSATLSARRFGQLPSWGSSPEGRPADGRSKSHMGPPPPSPLPPSSPPSPSPPARRAPPPISITRYCRKMKIDILKMLVSKNRTGLE